MGAYIVEFEQGGADRAKYGARLLETLADDLKKKGIKGLGFTTLKMCRLFFQTNLGWAFLVAVRQEVLVASSAGMGAVCPRR